MFEHDDIDELLAEILASDDFAESVKDENFVGYDEEEIKQLAQELKQSIIEAYLNIVSQGAAFDVSTVSVNNYNTKGDEASIKITFNGSGLWRPSLFPKKYPDGVYDIFGLIANGYHAERRVFGEWRGRRISSQTFRAPNDFLQKVASDFELTHDGIQVILPDEWIND